MLSLVISIVIGIYAVTKEQELQKKLSAMYLRCVLWKDLKIVTKAHREHNGCS